MDEPHELTPEQIIHGEGPSEVLSPREILEEPKPDENSGGDTEALRPREDWLWLDKEKLDRKEIVAAQSRS